MPENRRYYNDPSYATTVSRDVPPGEYAWDSVVIQSGRPILDAELNLTQGVADYAKLLLAGKMLPSGFIRGQTSSPLEDYGMPGPGAGNENLFLMAKQTAFVAGMPIVIEYTDTTSAGFNQIELPTPPLSSGVAPDVKRTDFVFLEVWRTLVAPSPRAIGTAEIATPQTVAAADTFTINATAIGGPTVIFVADGGGSTGFAIGASPEDTALNLADAIVDPANGLYPTYVTAMTAGSSVVQITAVAGGVAGNGVTIATSDPAAIVLSAATLVGGASRPNKPSDSTVYRHGNVLSPLGVALLDELVDPVMNTETAQRVQIQYRIRVVSGINPKTEPNGYSNVGVLAQGAKSSPVVGYPFVPANNTTVSGNSDATAYGFLDNGLYVAGNGTQAAAFALGAVDGFVYSIPMCFVFRRNNATATGGFSPANNANGGLLYAHAAGFPNANLNASGPYAIAATKSDRPDGLFADIIDGRDLLDLRRHVTPPGYDFGSELRYQLQSLLDKKTATWQVDGSDWNTIGNGSGDQSTFPLQCDEIGRLAAQGGASPASGDTFRGENVRNFDHIARRFASQSVVERLVFEVLPTGFYPGGITVAHAGANTTWCEGDAITFDFDQLNPSTLQNWTSSAIAASVTSFWPVGTKVTDVLSVYHDDGHDVTPIDQKAQLLTVVGVGTPVVTISLDANSSVVNDGGLGVNHPVIGVPASNNGSTRRLFVELEVTYPTGGGLTQTPDVEVEPSTSSGYAGYEVGPIVENAPAQRPPEMHSTWIPNPKFRAGFREVKLEQRSAPGGVAVTDTVISRTTTTVYPPRRFFDTGLTVDGVAAASSSAGSSERRITLSAPVAGQSAVEVVYFPQDPIPNSGASGYQVSVYYRTNAPQTAGVQAGAIPPTLLPTELRVEMVTTSAEVWSGQAGAGSTELGFPYEAPLDQIAIATGSPPASSPKEWYFSALSEVTISDFSANVGLLSLHSLVQVDGTHRVQLGDSGLGRGPVKDPEFRAYYDYAAAPTGYRPTAMAQPLFGATRHKVFQAALVRSLDDTLLFRKGELLLMVLSRFADLDSNNKIAFTDLPAIRTAAAIYRTRNLLLTVGD